MIKLSELYSTLQTYHQKLVEIARSMKFYAKCILYRFDVVEVDSLVVYEIRRTAGLGDVFLYRFCVPVCAMRWVLIRVLIGLNIYKV